MYGGANGNKIGIVYQGEHYMLKFPPNAKLNPLMSYSNSCISEEIGCKIYRELGIEAQETILGTYQDKIVVACKDMEVNGYRMKDFAFLKNTIVTSYQEGYGTELSDILETIQLQQIMDKFVLEKRFWEMFIVDSFLGNFDRHNGNWGFLINEQTLDVKLAPVYDCGSCLYPQLTEDAMQEILHSKEKIEERVYKFPTSAIKHQGVKINYFAFLSNTQHPNCIDTLYDITNRINLKRIGEIIDETPYVSNIHKCFMLKMLEIRKEKILDESIRVQEIKQKHSFQWRNFSFDPPADWNVKL